MCSRDDGRYAAAHARYTDAFAGVAHEIVRVADARSMSEGYNRGLAQVRGEIVLMSHDDLELLAPRDFARRLIGHMRRFDLLGVAGTSRVVGPAWIHAVPPHLYGQLVHPDKDPAVFLVSIYSTPTRGVGGMQAIDGVLMCARRRLLDKLRFDERFDRFHLYDVDFSYAAHLAGFSVGVACDLDVFHNSFGRYDNPEWVGEAHKFIEKHAAVLPSTPVPLKWRATTLRMPGLEAAARLLRPDHWAD